MSKTAYIHDFEVIKTMRYLLKHTNTRTSGNPSANLYRHRVLQLVIVSYESDIIYECSVFDCVYILFYIQSTIVPSK